MSTYDELRERHNARHGEIVGELLPRITWPREQIATERDAALRRIVARAKECSAWHAERLRDVDVDTIAAAGIAHLPVMTKDDLMANWDAIVTDRRLTLDLCERHLQDLHSDAYLMDEFHVVASGGSSGRRGVFAYDWDSWATGNASFVRWVMRSLGMTPEFADRGVRVAIVAAEKPTHMTSAMAQTFSNPVIPVHRFPVTLPIREIIRGLNETQPTVMQGYASIMFELAQAQMRGDLAIRPLVVGTTSEPLLPEIRQAMKDAWGVPITNWWGTSEGAGNGIACGVGEGMHLADDLLIIEPVDTEGRPVAPGTTSAKIYLTNLFNPLLPLIRYEVTDEVTVRTEPCACGSTFTRIDDILGRADDCFVYGDAVVHPHVFRSPLSRESAIVEYQVRQTRDGACILVRCSGELDDAALARSIEEALGGVGVRGASVEVARVASIERSAAGKLKRFVAL